jgi:hypothetical protein
MERLKIEGDKKAKEEIVKEYLDIKSKSEISDELKDLVDRFLSKVAEVE